MVLQVVLQETVARQAQVGVPPQAVGSGEQPWKRTVLPRPPPVMFPQYWVAGLQSAQLVAPPVPPALPPPPPRAVPPPPPRPPLPPLPKHAFEGWGKTPALIRKQSLEYVLPSQPHTRETFKGQGSGSTQ